MKIQLNFGHLCQAELVCEDGFCQAHKNWFGECSGWDFVLILLKQITSTPP